MSVRSVSCRDAVDAPLSGASPAPCAPVDRNLRLDGFRYSCRIVAQPSARVRPVVILGGSEQDKSSWAPQTKLLSSLGTVVTVDLPGYGDADFLPARHGPDFLAGAVAHMLGELRLERVNLVGVCYGGMVALRFAQRYPRFLDRLALVGTRLTIPAAFAEMARQFEELRARAEHERIAAIMVETFMSPPTLGRVRRRAAVSRLLYRQFLRRATQEAEAAVENIARLLGHDVYRPLPVPDVPMLAVTGEFDTLCAPSTVREVAGLFPSASFTTVREADHLMPLERPAEFADLIGRFCAGRLGDGLPYCNAVERH
ncbi:alpha/beta hydrolase [Streptomyces radicis]|uniref:Alpha/beta hydrolase n=1 Tax=Streptomyces radicis TaxID=1750517 RepID=A0A3A9W4G3_9ACTN|nr:alpha/beta hydrolase [Streptomyces radicis]RKN20413.1 alpha/beta hydrolase [Streptomyces radicis]